MMGPWKSGRKEIHPFAFSDSLPFATELSWARSPNVGRGLKYWQLRPENGKKILHKSLELERALEIT